MESVLIFFQMCSCVFLVLVVLLQAGQGGGLGSIAGGSGDTTFGAHSKTFMSQLTAFVAFVFMCFSFLISFIEGRKHRSLIVPTQRQLMQEYKKKQESNKGEQATAAQSEGASEGTQQEVSKSTVLPTEQSQGASEGTQQETSKSAVLPTEQSQGVSEGTQQETSKSAVLPTEQSQGASEGAQQETSNSVALPTEQSQRMTENEKAIMGDNNGQASMKKEMHTENLTPKDTGLLASNLVEKQRDELQVASKDEERILPEESVEQNRQQDEHHSEQEQRQSE